MADSTRRYEPEFEAALYGVIVSGV